MDHPGVFGVERSNENGLRSFPLVADGGLPPDVFTDACVLSFAASGAGQESDAPVPSMLSVDFSSGSVLVDCGDAVAEGDLLSDGASSGAVPLFSGGVYRGCLATGPGFRREVESGRSFDFGEGGIPLSASCVHRVERGCVESVGLPDGGGRTSDTVVEIAGVEGELWPELSERPDGDWDLRFHALNTNVESERLGRNSYKARPYLKALGVVVLGKSLIDAYDGTLKVAASGDVVWQDDYREHSDVFVFTPDMSRDDVCYRAHRDSASSYIYDACDVEPGCEPSSPRPRGTEMSVHGCSVWLRTDIENRFETNWPKNAVSITPIVGSSMPVVPRLDMASAEEAEKEMKKLVTDAPDVGNGIMISIPGMGVENE